MGNASERRTERVKSMLLGAITDIIRDELADPRIGIYSITEMNLSRDLTSAELLVAAVGGEQASNDCATALNRAAPIIWNRLRHETDLRSVPKLHFSADHRGKYADEVFRTIEALKSRGELEILREDTADDEAAPDGETEEGRQSAI